MRQIKEMLENAEIIHAMDDGVIKPGKLVTLRYEDEEPETYLLGLREEHGGDHDILTPESPIGQALVGHLAGETIVAKVPAGDLKIRSSGRNALAIRSAPERSGSCLRSSLSPC